MNLLMIGGDTTVAAGEDGALYQMLRRFSAHWDRIDMICPRAPGTQARTVHGNVHFYPSPWPKLFQPWFIVRQGRKLMKERQYDLVVTHDFGTFYTGIGTYLLTRGQGVPYVSEIHHIDGYPRAVTLREKMYRALAQIYLRWVWRHVLAIRVVNTVEVPELLKKLGVPQEKILHLPSFYLDFDVFHPMPGEPCNYDLLFVGRLASNKGLFTLLDALAQVKQTYPAVRLGILGRGPLLGAVEERIAALNLGANVTFIPRQPSAPDVARVYNQAKMLICASTAEGGPRVTVEAMACGVPAISTPVGVMVELVEDGVNGLLFHWDAAELAGKVNQLLADDHKRAEIGEQGGLAVQKFQADEVIQRYAQGYQDLVRRAKED